MNIRTYKWSFGFAVAAIIMAAMAAHADTLNGTTVSGSLSTAGSGYVTSVTNQFGSPVVVGPGTEFSGTINDFLGDTFGVTADFSNGNLAVAFSTPGNPFTNISYNYNSLLNLTFTDSAFVTPFTLTGVTCGPGSSCYDQTDTTFLLDNTLSGSTLTLDFRGIYAGVTYNFTDGPASVVSPAPEPSSLWLMGTGMLGAAGAMRRRSRG